MVLSDLRLSAGAVPLSPSQQSVLRESVRRGQSAFVEAVSGPWTDALPMLVLLEWDRASRELTSPSLQSTATAVQAWMQVSSAYLL